ncbi:MAG: WG repeat-containing protein [Cyclobacteriaceae bacterium]
MRGITVLIIIALILGCSKSKDGETETTPINTGSSTEDWVRTQNPETYQEGNMDTDGDWVIPFDRYQMVFTDTFRTLAFVFDPELTNGKIVAINRNEEVLFEVYNFDNGPDPVSDGLFRILENGKIGYANMEGEVVITPQYTCAKPFRDGRARMSNRCTTTQEGEHNTVVSGVWYYIDKEASPIRNPALN